jgi:AraC-like DNA-binding protein
MYFDFSLKSSLLLIFFFHGLVFSILLFVKGVQHHNKPGLWLGFLSFLSVCYISPFMLGYAGWYSKQPYRDILFYIPFQQLLLLPPVLYFYVRSLLDKSFRFSKKQWLHFLPAIGYLVYSIIIVVADTLILKDHYFYNDEKDKDFSIWYQVAGFLSMGYYLILSLSTYKKYRTISYDTLSFADTVTFKWAQRFLLAFLLLLTIRALFFILNPEWYEFGRKFWYYICFSLLFYYISIIGYTNTVRSLVSFNDLSLNAPSNTSENVEEHQPLPDEDSTPDLKTEIPDLAKWKETLEQLMLVDKLYEDPELTLSDLSQKLGIHSKKVSQIINQGFNLNFNDFVNLYRTKAVIARLEEGEHNLHTLLSIAFECGFNSKSTFNRAFKRTTSLSPREYIEKHHPQ